VRIHLCVHQLYVNESKQFNIQLSLEHSLYNLSIYQKAFINMYLRILIISLIFTSNLLTGQSVGINNTGSLPDNSAMLDIQSNSKGVLIPRLDSGQRTGIMPAAEGLLVFDTDTKSFWFYNGGWIELVSGNIDELSDTDGNTKIQVEKSPNDNNIRFDVDGDEVMVIDETGEVEIRSKGINSPGFLSLNNIDTSHFLRIYGGKGDGPDPFFAWHTGTALRFVTSDKFFGGFQERWRMISNRLEPIGTGGSVFIGFDAGLNDDLSGNYNVAIGDKALTTNTTGYYNTAIGRSTLSSNTEGFGNVAIGYRPLFNSTTGDYNIGIGQEALFSNTIGGSNIAIGLQALHLNTEGNNNSAIGVNSMYNNLTGNDNSALGYQALNRNSIGNENSAVGVRALFYNQTGSGNTAIGYEALKGEVGNSSGSNNTSIGSKSLFSNGIGYNNTSVGYEALYSNTEGYSNTVTGLQALYSNTTGNGNTAYGEFSLLDNTSGNFNSAFGQSSLINNTEGDYNISIGVFSLNANTTGSNNLALGTRSLEKNVDGEYNVAIGDQALSQNSNGENNIAIGRQALNTNLTGNSNISIGNYSGVISTSLTNSVTIGNNTFSNCSDCIILGGTGLDAVNVGIGTTNPTKARFQVEGATGDNDFQGTQYAIAIFPNPVGFFDVTLSAYFEDDIAAGSFYAFSDERIKNIRGRSDAKLDLETIMNIEVTDYTMIDTISKGNKNYKKVIAQQVAEFYPQAVSSNLTDVIPDIYKRAEIKDDWIALSTDLKVGERVKLITDKITTIYDVIEVNPLGFRVDNLPENTDRVFVYGREVKDFHIVDYEALSMLNISATQAQQEIIEAQAEVITDLNARLQQLMNRMDKMEATIDHNLVKME
jgi:hypothetical protein